MLFGFKRARIQPLTETQTPDGNVITIEGTQNEGATVEADITGLSSDPVKMHASDVAYHVAQKGTGDVSVAFTILDLPQEAEARVLGYKQDSSFGAYLVGEETAPPYCALILETYNQFGDVVDFGFFKGKFSKPSQKLKTKEGGNVTPESVSYTFAAVEQDVDIAAYPDAKGNAMAEFIGDAASAASFTAAVLRDGV